MQHGAFISAVSAPLAVIDTLQGTAPWSRINRKETEVTDSQLAEVQDLLLTDYDLSLIDESVDDWPTTDPREQIWDWPTVAFSDGLGFDVPADETL